MIRLFSFSFSIYLLIGLLNFSYASVPQKEFSFLKKNISRVSTEEKAIEIISQIDITTLSSYQLVELYQVLVSKGYHVTIIEHLFSVFKKQYPDIIYNSLFLLNEHQQILNFAFASLNENSVLTRSHLNALDQIILKGKSYVLTNQNYFPLKKLNEKENYLLQFYLAFFQKKFIPAYRYLVKANAYSNDSGQLTSHLEKRFTNEAERILEVFYQYAFYKEFLLMMDLNNLFGGRNSPKIVDLVSKATFYNTSADYMGYAEQNTEPSQYLYPPASLLTMMKEAFYSNDYLYLQQLCQEGKQTNLFLAISLLEQKKHGLYRSIFLKPEGDSFYHLLHHVYQQDETKFKTHFLVQKNFQSSLSEEELEIKNLIQLNNVFISELMEIIRLKYSHSLGELQSLYLNKKTSLPPLIKDYVLVSLMEMLLNVSNYEGMESFYKKKYFDINSSSYQERAIYYYGKSLEKNHPSKAKAIYQKLLFKNPNTFYKFQIQIFLNSIL